MVVSNPGGTEVAQGDGVSLLGVARSLEPLIREHAAALEQGSIPPPLVEALYDAGVFKAMLPREVGGLEAEPVEWLRLIEELARINASVGWMAFIQSGVGLTFLDPERFERFRLRGGGRLILAMSLGRLGGKAVKAEGGYRISGRWPFASGSPYATWLGGMSVVCDSAGAPVLDANGQPQRLLAIWPAGQARIIDTWDGLGLRGTGSGDIEITDLFVPDDQVNPGFYGPPAYDRALFRIKEMPEVGHGAHALGVASAARESFVAAVNSKPVPGAARPMVSVRPGRRPGPRGADASARDRGRRLRGRDGQQGTGYRAAGPAARGEHLLGQGGEGGGRPHLRNGRIECRVPGARDRASVPRHQHRGQPHQLRGVRVQLDRLLFSDQGPGRRPGDRRSAVLLRRLFLSLAEKPHAAGGDAGPVPAPVARMAAAMSDRSSSFSSRLAAGSHPST